MHNIRERNVPIRSEIWSTNIRSLGFRNIREWVILCGVDITEFRVYSYVLVEWYKDIVIWRKDSDKVKKDNHDIAG